MARPTSISRQQILEVARGLFLAEGASVSTAHIARAAGISEGSIFKRFATKEELFRAALDLPQLDLEALMRSAEGHDDPREALLAISRVVIDFFRDLVPRMMMLWANACGAPHGLLERKGDAPPLRLFRAVTGHFTREMEAGRIRAADPEVFARMLIGSLHNYVFLETIGAHTKTPGDAHEYARGVVDLLWHGAAPQPAPRVRTAGARVRGVSAGRKKK